MVIPVAGTMLLVTRPVGGEAEGGSDVEVSEHGALPVRAAALTVLVARLASASCPPRPRR